MLAVFTSGRQGIASSHSDAAALAHEVERRQPLAERLLQTGPEGLVWVPRPLLLQTHHSTVMSPWLMIGCIKCEQQMPRAIYRRHFDMQLGSDNVRDLTDNSRARLGLRLCLLNSPAAGLSP